MYFINVDDFINYLFIQNILNNVENGNSKHGKIMKFLCVKIVATLKWK